MRFFYVDSNWIGALLDGAMSIGLESSLQTFFQQMTGTVVQQAALEAAQVIDGETNPGGIISGMLLRSDLVSGWPNLSVRPLDASGAMLDIVRMDHLAPGVLLCLFSGVPAQVMIAEPPEGFAFGTNELGDVQLRTLVAPLGNPLTTVQIRDPSGQQTLCMRPGTNVLNIDPTSATGLVQTLLTALTGQSQPVTLANFGPADFALQMIQAPEQLTFASQGGA